MRSRTEAPPGEHPRRLYEGLSPSEADGPRDAGWASRRSAHPKQKLLHSAASVTLVSQVMSSLSPTLILIQHRRICDTPAVSPVVRTGDADRSRGLVDIGDGHGHCSDHGRRAAGSTFCPMEELPPILSTAGSPGGFSFTVTALLYVADTLSPTLN